MRCVDLWPIGLLLMLVATVSAQNKPMLFGLDEVPQSLMINPGATLMQDAHIGVPLASGFHLNVGSSGVSLYDLVGKQDGDITQNISSVLNSLNDRDFFTLTQQLELLNFGWRSGRKRYYSGGIYQELDMITYFPKDWFTLAWNGNAEYLDYPFKFDHINARMDALSVFHFGVNQSIGRHWIVGARVKIYNSILSVSSLNNKGSFTTSLSAGDSDNYYAQKLSRAEVSIQTSGLSRFDDGFTQADLVSSSLLGGNLGLGIDVGATYTFDDQLKVSASLQDLGAIFHASDVKTYQAVGNKLIEGIELDFPVLSSGQSLPPYYAIFENELEAAVPIDTLYSAYTQWRPVKFNAGISYGFGPAAPGSPACNCTKKGKPFTLESEVGFQYFAIKRPKGIQMAATVFYLRRLYRFLLIKSTYTIDALSATNIGLGVVGDFGNFNIYLAGDHALKYGNLAKARGLSVQFGLNFKFLEK